MGYRTLEKYDYGSMEKTMESLGSTKRVADR